VLWRVSADVLAAEDTGQMFVGVLHTAPICAAGLDHEMGGLEDDHTAGGSAALMVEPP